AITAYRAKRYSLIRATAIAYSLVERTLQRRIARHLLRAQGYEHRQILSNAEEKTLVRWITRLTVTGYPALPALVLTAIFEPTTRPLDLIQRRLLIIDSYSSYITANFIAYYIDKAINILILLPYSSHILQPLDISIFAPLKRVLTAETDVVSQLDSGRISRVKWTEIYIRTRVRAFTVVNIQSDSKHLRTLVKRYTQRMTSAFKTTQSDLITIRKRLAFAEQLLYTRKARKTGKRVTLKGKFVF
ncbi:MAG: hypothetical protein FE78DRAFT_86014, partial [Acidomyces sp. 'richmondensis']